MCRHEWQLVRFIRASDPEGRPRLGARTPEGGRIVDLQAAHVALRGSPSPHLRDVSAFRLAASYGADLASELVVHAPPEALLTSAEAQATS